jgi:hypothetical protein
MNAYFTKVKFKPCLNFSTEAVVNYFLVAGIT